MRAPGRRRGHRPEHRPGRRPDLQRGRARPRRPARAAGAGAAGHAGGRSLARGLHRAVQRCDQAAGLTRPRGGPARRGQRHRAGAPCRDRRDLPGGRFRQVPGDAQRRRAPHGRHRQAADQAGTGPCRQGLRAGRGAPGRRLDHRPLHQQGVPDDRQRGRDAVGARRADEGQGPDHRRAVRLAPAAVGLHRRRHPGHDPARRARHGRGGEGAHPPGGAGRGAAAARQQPAARATLPGSRARAARAPAAHPDRRGRLRDGGSGPLAALPDRRQRRARRLRRPRAGK